MAETSPPAPSTAPAGAQLPTSSPTEPSSRPASPRTPSPISRLAPTHTSQDRLDAILERARRRAESLSLTPLSEQQPGPSAPVRMEPLLRNQSAPGALPGRALSEHESSADETTRIVSSRSSARHVNYQTMATATTGGAAPQPGPATGAGFDGGVRPRKTASRVEARAESSRSRHSAAGSAPAAAAVPWWRSALAGMQSMELENKGSVARDHLALERTFLAWLRTSLAFASIGIAVTQLFRLNTAASDSGNDGSRNDTLRHVGRPLGSTFLAISILILFLGYHRYYQSQQWILRGKFPASRGTILVVSLVAFALMVTSLVVVIVVRPHR